MLDIHFCPRCHKGVARLEYPEVFLPQYGSDDALMLEDAEVEEGLEAGVKRVVRVLTAPAWKAAITTYENSMSKVSFGCPWCGKGKVTLF